MSAERRETVEELRAWLAKVEQIMPIPEAHRVKAAIPPAAPPPPEAQQIEAEFQAWLAKASETPEPRARPMFNLNRAQAVLLLAASVSLAVVLFTTPDAKVNVGGSRPPMPAGWDWRTAAVRSLIVAGAFGVAFVAAGSMGRKPT